MNQELHRWAGASVVAFEAGLLDEDDRARLLEHVRGCDSCKEVWESYHAAAPDCQGELAGEVGRHVSAAMLARWDRAWATLRGTEREMVARHLSSCAACREALELLGYSPELDAVTSSVAPQPTTPLSAVTRSAPAPSRPRDRRWRMLAPWVGGGAIGAALAAALLALIVLPVDRPTPDGLGPRTQTGATSGGTAGAIPGAARGPAPGTLPWVAAARARGEAGASVREVPADARAIVLLVPVPRALESSTSAIVEVVSPSGSVVLEQTVGGTDLATRTVAVVLASIDPLPAGTYRVVLRAAGGDASVQGELPAPSFFELRHTPAPPARR